MKLEGEGKLLRIFIGENDRWHGKPKLDEMVADGMITLENVQVITYRPGKDKSAPV